MSRKFSLAYLTVPGVTPLEQIRIAAEAGYDYVSLRTIPMGLPGEPQIHLENDPTLFSQVQSALVQTGLKLLDIELVRVREDLPRDLRPAFEAGARLGATNVLSSVWTKDRAFAVDRYAEICDQAAEFGMDVNVEFPIVSQMTRFSDTVALQEQVGKANLKVFVDTLYAHWDNLTTAQILSLPPERYGIIHLCDCPRQSRDQEITHIVREGRAYCGHGQIDLVQLLKALPEHPCSIELPNLENMQRYGAADHARRCLESAKALFYTHDL